MAGRAQGLVRVVAWPFDRLTEARGRLFPWVPVCLGTGTGLWFLRPDDPGGMVLGAVAAAVLALAAVRLWGPEWLHPVVIAAALLGAGFLAADLRSRLVAAPVLSFRYYGPVQGRIVDIDRSQTDALRLTLDQVVLADVPPARTPLRVRLSLHGDWPWLDPAPGQTVQMTAHLAAAEGPVAPGGFDFRRVAWFQGLGAVGYTRHPVLLVAEPTGAEQWVNRTRTALARGITSHVPGDPGAFAAGVMTGDRSGLSLEAVSALRDSSLAHLLAISGMNMAFLVGFVFALVRTGIALVPPLALRVNAKKIAAVLSFGVAWFYLLLSGANVATERAFIMVCVMLGGVVLDRRAISLRSVALAAVVLLVLRPESLLDPGFQMSFAATTALIAGFRIAEPLLLGGRVPGWVMPAVTLVLSSAVAGVATAPFGAAHFNRFADFGFVANLLTVPVMGAVVMPAGAVAALAAPLDLEDLPLRIMGLGCEWILFVAGKVAEREGAVTAIIAPGPWVLPLISVGGIWICACLGRWRLIGLLPVAVAIGIWSQERRPDLLIAPDAAILGLDSAEGRAISHPKGAGFVAQSWLEDDGDLADQRTAADRPGFRAEGRLHRFQLGQLTGIHLKGKGAEAEVSRACAEAALVIVAARLTQRPQGCLLIDQADLARSGAMAIWANPDGLRIEVAYPGHRRWHPDQ